jgi:hypothetical protein
LANRSTVSADYCLEFSSIRGFFLCRLISTGLETAPQDIF